ncbi:STAS domain-containing protein [Streptomyces pratensis]|uniref:STAS domain-containing protein n=1 Tax=Streptomyces pratensis TaxID=1169025 RepID=UPI0030160416
MIRHPRLNTRVTGAGAVIELAGDLDHHTTQRVRAALTGLDLRAGQQLVLDLGGLAFCDSTGITVIVAARNRASAAEAAVVLAAVPAHVSRVFRIVGLDRVFTSCPTAQDAEAARRPPAA